MPTPAPMLVLPPAVMAPICPAVKGGGPVRIGFTVAATSGNVGYCCCGAERHESDPIAGALAHQLYEERRGVLSLVELRAANRRRRRCHAARSVEDDHDVLGIGRWRRIRQRSFDRCCRGVHHAATKPSAQGAADELAVDVEESRARTAAGIVEAGDRPAVVNTLLRLLRCTVGMVHREDRFAVHQSGITNLERRRQRAGRRVEPDYDPVVRPDWLARARREPPCDLANHLEKSRRMPGRFRAVAVGRVVERHRGTPHVVAVLLVQTVTRGQEQVASNQRARAAADVVPEWCRVVVFADNDSDGGRDTVFDRSRHRGQGAGGLPPSESSVALEPRLEDRLLIRIAVEKRVGISLAALERSWGLPWRDTRLAASEFEQPGAAGSPRDANPDRTHRPVDGTGPEVGSRVRVEDISAVAQIDRQGCTCRKVDGIEMQNDKPGTAKRTAGWHQIQARGMRDRPAIRADGSQVVTHRSLRSPENARQRY